MARQVARDAIVPRMRPGFTLIEMLVAVVVFSVGVLALAATAALVAGHIGDGGRLTSSAHAARSTLDSLASRPCDDLASGSFSRASADVRWRVARDSAAASVELSVMTPLRGRQVQRDYQALVPCDR